MNRDIVITLKVNQEERDLISRLAKILQRSRSDTIRFVLLRVLKKLEDGKDDLDLIKHI